jgi:hypothetical protein
MGATTLSRTQTSLGSHIIFPSLRSRVPAKLALQHQWTYTEAYFDSFLLSKNQRDLLKNNTEALMHLGIFNLSFLQNNR